VGKLRGWGGGCGRGEWRKGEGARGGGAQRDRSNSKRGYRDGGSFNQCLRWMRIFVVAKCHGFNPNNIIYFKKVLIHVKLSMFNGDKNAN